MYNLIFYIPLDIIKFIIRYALSGRAWDLVIEQRVESRLAYFINISWGAPVFSSLKFHVPQIAFTRKKDFGKEERELRWAHAQRTLHGLHPPETKTLFDRTNYTELNQMAEEAKRRAEIARYILMERHSLCVYFDTNYYTISLTRLLQPCCRLRELHTLKGHVESVVRLKGLDIDTIQQAYTV